MRLLTAFFLSLCLAFNATYAAGNDVCDALGEGTSEGLAALLSVHGQHFGHHVHAHDDAPAVNDQASPADPTVAAAHSDHCHPHQCFTSVLPGELHLPSLIGPQVLPLGPTARIVSLPPSRLERPPRAALS
jgi:hypothetical protein